jgi:hypothetical protein
MSRVANLFIGANAANPGLSRHSRIAAIWSYPIELTRLHFRSASKLWSPRRGCPRDRIKAQLPLAA